MILTLLSCLYEGRPLQFSEEEWTEALERAVKYDLAPQVFHLIRERSNEVVVPAFVMDALKIKAASVTIRNAWVKEETERIAALLEQRGVPVIVLKGTVFAERFYGHFGARKTSDIDLLIPAERFAESEDCLLQAGYIMTDGYHSLHYHVEYTKQDPISGRRIRVELHRSLLRRHRSKIDIHALWREAEPVRADSGIKQFTLGQTIYTICLHSSKHGMIRYKHVLDIAHLIYLYGPKINFDELLDRSKKDGTLGMVSGALSAAYRLFPGLNKRKPLPRFMRRIPWYSESFVLHAEQGKKGLQYYFHQFMYPLLTSDGFVTAYLHVRYSIFPPRDQIERMLRLTRRLPGPILYAKLYTALFRKTRAERESSQDAV